MTGGGSGTMEPAIKQRLSILDLHRSGKVKWHIRILLVVGLMGHWIGNICRVETCGSFIMDNTGCIIAVQFIH